MDLLGLLRLQENKGCQILSLCHPLIPFPTKRYDRHARQKWKLLVNRVGSQGELWSPSKDSRVCSLHFVDGGPTPTNPYPSLNLGYDDAKKRVGRILFADFTSPAKQRKNNVSVSSEGRASTDPPVPTLPPFIPSVFTFHYSWFISILIFILGIFNSFCTCKTANDTLQKKIKGLSNLLSQERHKITQLNSQMKRKDVSKELLSCNKDVQFYTGIETKEIFNEILALVKPYITRRWRGRVQMLRKVRRFMPKRASVLSAADELLLTLMKLRLGLLTKDLAKRFGISAALCSQIFFTWLRGLSLVLGNMIHMPELDHITASKPSRYRHLPDIYAIIDCTEIFIETPKDLFLQSATWSEYKHHNTVKILIAVAPNSCIIYVSEAYTGRISDKMLTLQCKFLDKVPPYSMIMADKGFNLQTECANRCISLHVPPGRRGQSQMTSSSVRKTKHIANLRILVEQVIRELKTFRILQQELPLTLVPRVNDIVTVCSALVNWRKPMYSD